MGASDSAGYIKLFRKALGSGILQRRGGLRLFGLFCAMLLEARWKPGTVDGEPLQAGQLLITMRRYATAHGLSVKELRIAIKMLTETGTLRAQQRAHRHTVLTLANWALYNGEPGEEGTAKGTEEGTPRAHQGHTEPLEGPSPEAFSAPKKGRRKEERKDIVGQARLVILDLNEQTGKRFRSDSKATIRLVEARFNEGHSFEDFKRVHRTKTMQWKDDPKMEPYLRPETLYTPKHFESYLNEAPPTSMGPSGEEAATRLSEDLAILEDAVREADGLPDDRRVIYLQGVLRRLGKYPNGRPPQLESGIASLMAALALEVAQ
jgi:uncharacterized phage protein (TIGR02220 family)